MTNAHDFSLDDELDATAAWDDDEDRATRTTADARAAGPTSPTPRTTPTAGAMELAERHALRRVAEPVAPSSRTSARSSTASCASSASCWSACGPRAPSQDAENSMAELALLAETAGSEVLEAVYQRRQTPDPATYVGRGKVDGIREIVQATGADTVICDGELAPSQLRNLEDRLKVKVVDRTALILDIFAQHAKSKRGPGADRAGPAQLHEAAPARLGRQPLPPGRWPGRPRAPASVAVVPVRPRSRPTAAGSTPRSPSCAASCREMKGTRDTKRADRRRHAIPSVAIAGYTNAGKSSLLNRLTDAGVLVEDSLFATLDPTTRRTTTSDGRIYTMSDTVGFVRHLPHQLVEAFRSTLEEVADSDLILHVVDGSHPDPEGQLAAVREVFAEIGADQVPELIVINKADAADPMVLARLRQREPHSVVVSAKTGEGIAEALALVEGELPRPGVEFQRAAALRARRPGQPDPPAGRDRLDGAHRRRHAGRRPRARGPRGRAGGVRRLTPRRGPAGRHAEVQAVTIV